MQEIINGTVVASLLLPFHQNHVGFLQSKKNYFFLSGKLDYSIGILLLSLNDEKNLSKIYN